MRSPDVFKDPLFRLLGNLQTLCYPLTHCFLSKNIVYSTYTQVLALFYPPKSGWWHQTIPSCTSPDNLTLQALLPRHSGSGLLVSPGPHASFAWDFLLPTLVELALPGKVLRARRPPFEG